MKNILMLLTLSLIILLVTGCTTHYPVIRADNSMLANNPIQKIAIIGSSTVIWKVNSDEPYTDLQSSTKAIEVLMPTLKVQLESKGYTIIFSEPIAAALPLKSFRGKIISNYPLYADYKNKGEDSKLPNLEDSIPGKIYDLSKSSIKKPALALAFELADSLSESKNTDILSYQPKKEYVANILAITNADTLCQVRVLGYHDERFSFPNLNDAILGLLFPKHETSLLSLVCSDTSGKVLWSKAFHLDNDDPTNIEAEQIKKYLANFPTVGAPLAKSCTKHEDKDKLYACD